MRKITEKISKIKSWSFEKNKINKIKKRWEIQITEIRNNCESYRTIKIYKAILWTIVSQQFR